MLLNFLFRIYTQIFLEISVHKEVFLFFRNFENDVIVAAFAYFEFSFRYFIFRRFYIFSCYIVEISFSFNLKLLGLRQI